MKSTSKRSKKPTRMGNASALDLQENMSYEGIKDIYHAVGRTSRSASEAFKDADYAQAIWQCESDFAYGVRFITDMVKGMFTVFMYLIVPVLLSIWLFR